MARKQVETGGAQATLAEAHRRLDEARDQAIKAFGAVDESRRALGRAQADLSRDGLPDDLKAHAAASRRARVVQAEQGLVEAEQSSLAAAARVRDAEQAVRAAELEVARPEIEAANEKILAAEERFLAALLTAADAAAQSDEAWYSLYARDLPTRLRVSDGWLPLLRQDDVDSQLSRTLTEAAEAAIGWGGRSGGQRRREADEAERVRQAAQDAENARVKALREKSMNSYPPVDSRGRVVGDGKGGSV